jgi:hypothetical protein
MNHTHTAKNGWELKETTVELDYDIDDEFFRPTSELTHLAESLHIIGVTEADRRNHEESGGMIGGPGGVPID